VHGRLLPVPCARILREMLPTDSSERPNRPEGALSRAYARGLFGACGVQDLDARPLVGVASAWNELVPGHAHLDRVARAAQEGARAAGANAVIFPTMALCDGI